MNNGLGGVGVMKKPLIFTSKQKLVHKCLELVTSDSINGKARRARMKTTFKFRNPLMK